MSWCAVLRVLAVLGALLVVVEGLLTVDERKIPRRNANFRGFSNGNLADATRQVEELIKQDELAFALKDVRAKRRGKTAVETLFAVDFPGAKDKFLVLLDRKHQRGNPLPKTFFPSMFRGFKVFEVCVVCEVFVLQFHAICR